MFPARCLIVFSIKHRAGVDVYCLVLHAARDSLVNIFVPLKVKYKQISHSIDVGSKNKWLCVCVCVCVCVKCATQGLE